MPSASPTAPTVGTDPARATRLFLAVVLGYFAAQVVLRLVLGGALETDEAEMLVMTPGLRLGYGPQLPLYNWSQVLLFELFGRNLFALSLLKNLLLAATYLFMFAAFRAWMPAGRAALLALSIYLIPDLAWEAERATTHSNMLIATSAATLAAFSLAARRPGPVAGLALGLALGAGGLAKYNFWLVPGTLALAAASLPALRGRVFARAHLLALPVAAAILVAPMGWILANRDLALSSTDKLQMAAGGGGEGLQGLGELVAGFALLLALPALVAGAMRLLSRGQPAPARAPGTDEALLRRWLLRAAALGALALALAVPAAGIGHVTPRWLLPVVFLAVPGLFLAVLPGSAPRARRVYAGLLLLLALGVFAGLAWDRYKPEARRDLRFEGLPALIEPLAPQPGTPVVAEFYTAGNLARLRADWRIAPYLPFAAREFGGGPVLFLFREKLPRDLRAALAQAGWPAGTEAQVLAEGAFALPYGQGGDRSLPMRYILALVPALPPPDR